MKHLAHNGHQLATKNKLQQHVQEYLKGLDRTLIDHNHLDMFKERILYRISIINDVYPRCTPINASWFELDPNDWLLYGFGFSNFMIYHIKTEF